MLASRRGRWPAIIAVAALAAIVAATTILPDGSRDGRLTAGQCVTSADAPSVARVWNDQILDAIRRDVPAPTVHSRNLFHLSAAMWDAWAAFEPTATGVFTAASVEPKGTTVEAARVDAITFAAVTIVQSRYRNSIGGTETLAALDSTMLELCGATVSAAVDAVEPGTAAAFGVDVGRMVLESSADDGSHEADGYADPTYTPVNPPMNVRFPGTRMADPNRWQPLFLESAVTQNDLPLADGPQVFIGSQWGSVASFALPTPSVTGLPIDPGRPPMLGSSESDDAFREAVVEVIRASSRLEVGRATIDISPRSQGASTLGTNDGHGYDLNPITGEPYEPTVVDQADYYRVLAEFWADGPDSETPPGHWNTIANDVSDALDAEVLRVGGEGEVVDRLEWDVKLYLALNGALHDAAIAAWGAKRYYDYVRPISMVRYMGALGQSTDPTLSSFHPDGLPLEPGLSELITAESASVGRRHAALADHVGEVAVYAWRGAPEDPASTVSGVGWIRAVEWVPYQRPDFVTPSFAAYVSGHSAFSRAGAEVMAAVTGSPFFPGGMAGYVFLAGELRHELGPTRDVPLQWATYGDAADEAGLSRIYGGIHVSADDFAGRLMGAECARLAWSRAVAFFGS